MATRSLTKAAKRKNYHGGRCAARAAALRASSAIPSSRSGTPPRTQKRDRFMRIPAHAFSPVHRARKTRRSNSVASLSRTQAAAVTSSSSWDSSGEDRKAHHREDVVQRPGSDPTADPPKEPAVSGHPTGAPCQVGAFDVAPDPKSDSAILLSTSAHCCCCCEAKSGPRSGRLAANENSRWVWNMQSARSLLAPSCD